MGARAAIEPSFEAAPRHPSRKKNLVFLSPVFPSHYHRFCRRLMASGTTVLGLGQMPPEQFRPELRDVLHNYYRVGNLHHYDELVRALGYFTHRLGKLDWIDSLNEHWLETEAGCARISISPG